MPSNAPVASEFAVDSPQALAEKLQGVDYLIPRSLATSTFLALRMGKPLLLEGDPGVGKTELALALSRAWPQAELQIIRDAGHSASEPAIIDALMRGVESVAAKSEKTAG